jgi:hypothetical protein
VNCAAVQVVSSDDVSDSLGFDDDRPARDHAEGFIFDLRLADGYLFVAKRCAL